MYTGQQEPGLLLPELNLVDFIAARREECVSRVIAGESFCSIKMTVSFNFSS